MGERAPELAWRTFGWIVRRQAQGADHLHAALIQVKNIAYAPTGTMRRGEGRRFHGWARGTNLFLGYVGGTYW
ncbi:hypothetical protein [Umezawaea sp. NPDC059074]|uniref:hypothetical protein n=1 Tax=Umezawaea sp. NPDC059074 TaxID=3346716 RepID=UPI0036B0B2D7